MAIPGTPESQAALQLAWRYLHDAALFEAHLPQRTHRDVLVARLQPHHAQQLLDAGIVELTSSDEARGCVLVFAVAEFVKRRLRAIQNTVDANNALPPAPTVAFRSIAARCELVHAGSAAAQVDFMAYYTQFPLAAAVRKYFCYRLLFPDGSTKLVQQCVGLTGMSHMVYTAVSATRHLLAFQQRSRASDDHIDNVLFVGDPDAVASDLATLRDRCRVAGVTINEDVTQPELLVATALDWCGLHLDFTAKTVALTTKVTAKIALSWSLRAGWTWRGFAAHIGLMWYTMQVISIPVAQFFNLLRFVSEISRRMQQLDDKNWDDTAEIWPCVWPDLEAWTALALTNAPRPVPHNRRPDVLVLVDSSAYGYGYIAVDTITGHLYQHGAPWPAAFATHHGDEKLRRSAFTEPWGILFTKRHLTPQLDSDRFFRFGTDSQTAAAVHRKGYSARSYDLNNVAFLDRHEFPNMRSEFVHVPGVQNIFADALSRGKTIADVETKGLSMQASLRRLLGDNPAELITGGG